MCEALVNFHIEENLVSIEHQIYVTACLLGLTFFVCVPVFDGDTKAMSNRLTDAYFLNSIHWVFEYVHFGNTESVSQFNVRQRDMRMTISRYRKVPVT